MIINIPLNIPDEILNNALAKDYEDKILKNLTEEVRKCIERRTYSTYDKLNRGLDAYVDDHIGKIVSENKEQIIELAADKLATKLARTKAAKEVAK